MRTKLTNITIQSDSVLSIWNNTEEQVSYTINNEPVYVIGNIRQEDAHHVRDVKQGDIIITNDNIDFEIK